MAQAPRIAVVGSANVDLVARCHRLPRPGETVSDAVRCQMEIPDAAIAAAAAAARFFCLNAAPARGRLELSPDLLVVNRYEYEVVGEQPGLVALTLGPEGAVLLEGGRAIARARPP